MKIYTKGGKKTIYIVSKDRTNRRFPISKPYNHTHAKEKPKIKETKLERSHFYPMH